MMANEHGFFHFMYRLNRLCHLAQSADLFICAYPCSSYLFRGFGTGSNIKKKHLVFPFPFSIPLRDDGWSGGAGNEAAATSTTCFLELAEKLKRPHVLGKRADKRSMKKCVNYEDNTFILNTRIRLLHDIFLLEADPALFFNKALDELDFINDALEMLLKDFIANDKLIERSDRFRDLLETEWRFTSVLNFLASGQGSLAHDFYPRFVPKLKSILGDCARRRGMIEDQKPDSENNQVDERLVSGRELSELLKEQ